MVCPFQGPGTEEDSRERVRMAVRWFRGKPNFQKKVESFKTNAASRGKAEVTGVRGWVESAVSETVIPTELERLGRTQRAGYSCWKFVRERKVSEVRR